MASGIGLVVKIAADTKKAVGDIKDVNTALDGTGTSTGTASKMFSGLKSAAVPVIGAVAAGVGAAAVAMVEFGKAAFEDQQEAKKLARVLETIPGITQDMVTANEEWITSTMFATHVMDTDLREAVGQLALITGDLALAQDYAARSADLASVANVEYKTATDAVEAALAGKTRALMGLAPWLDTNKDGTLDLAEAQGILTSTTLDGKAAAEAADDPWTTMSIIWGEIQEQLGSALLPLMNNLADWFKDPANQQKVQDFLNKMGELAGTVGEELVPALEDFTDWLTDPATLGALGDMKALIQDNQEKTEGWYDALALLKDIGDLFSPTTWFSLDKMHDNLVDIWDTLKDILGLEDDLDFFGIQGNEGWWHPGMGPQSAGVAGVARSGTTAPSGVSVNFYGGIHTDPEATARAITSSLRSSDWRNGRDRGRQLEPAW